MMKIHPRIGNEHETSLDVLDENSIYLVTSYERPPPMMVARQSQVRGHLLERPPGAKVVPPRSVSLSVGVVLKNSGHHAFGPRGSTWPSIPSDRRSIEFLQRQSGT